jgi:hypothetical protein
MGIGSGNDGVGIGIVTSLLETRINVLLFR